mmetsp:Transcript_83371/g.135166  ORF Transcript_83371/g.135166 Transcript_83371/m.135166 type:complete len:342 (-) Transcript_83371:13-1038(-)
MESLLSMKDTLELLELYEESQIAMLEAQDIGKRAQRENITSPLHLHQQICAYTKATMIARKELDDHTSTLHIGSKIRLHGLLNQTLNGKKGSVLGMASNNRIDIQLQEDQRQVNIRISNIRYRDDPEQNYQTLYDRMVAKAHIEIELLRAEIKIQIKKSGEKNINTVLARYNQGSALWLSNKPQETALVVKELDAVISFMTQREPNHPILSETMKIRDMALKTINNFETLGTLSAWPYWKPPTARWEDTLDMTQLLRELLAMTDREKELTITANTRLHGLYRHGLHEFFSPTPRLIDLTTFTEMNCDEIEKMKLKTYKPQGTSRTQTTEHQSSTSSAGDDT